MTTQIRENRYHRKLRISEKSSGPNENCSSSANFWANDLKSFAFERYELYLCDISPKLGPFFNFSAPIQKFQISRYSIFSAGQLCWPLGQTQKFFGPRYCFALHHMSRLDRQTDRLMKGDIEAPFPELKNNFTTLAHSTYVALYSGSVIHFLTSSGCCFPTFTLSQF